MKRIFLFAALLTAAVAETFACTNLIVGKNASTDGSTIVSYSADSYGLFGELYHYPAATYPKGTMMDIHEWDTGKYLGQAQIFADGFRLCRRLHDNQFRHFFFSPLSATCPQRDARSFAHIIVPQLLCALPAEIFHNFTAAHTAAPAACTPGRSVPASSGYPAVRT